MAPSGKSGARIGRWLPAALLGVLVIVGALPAASSAATPTPNWAQQTTATSPSARNGAATAFDPATGKLVLFGGFGSGGYSNETWTYDGTTWTQQSTAQSPPARTYASMAYDPAIGKIVLFGGYDGGDKADTWTYDGTTWTQQTPAQSPPGRNLASMAYDPAIGKLVLFGGASGMTLRGDTWTYDGTTWTQQTPAQSPPARDAASMAFDPATGKLVLFGGFGSSGYSNDTWTYNGTTWTQQTPASSPSGRLSASMAFDPAIGKLVLFGGLGSGSHALGDTWTYDGTTWTQQTAATSPPVLFAATMAFDPAIGRAVLFGGTTDTGNPYGGTWTFGLSPGLPQTWIHQTPAQSPDARRSAAMAFDPAIGKLVLFGGEGPFLGDTWTYDGATWTKQTPVTSPPGRRGAAMAFDPATGKIVLFGGDGDSSVRLGDTWTYDGTSWTQQMTAQSPPARVNASMAFDPAIGKLVLFGGVGSNYLGDTWTYDGTNWTQQSPAQSPPARHVASMAYDPAIGKLVLFGGFGSGGYTTDTWTYDGTTWAQQAPAQSPPARQQASMAFDSAIGRLVLFGGFNPIAGDVGDTWTYDGTTWAQQTPVTSQWARSAASMAFDPGIGKLVLFGGAGSSDLNETWTYETVTASPALTTTASSGTIGGTISDSATLAGGVSATGTITFRAYGPSDATCASAPAFTSSAIAVSGNGTYASGTFTPTQAGTYKWTATYTGDGSNDPATSPCGAADETSTVAKATPALSTAASAGVVLGGQIHDSATIASGYSPGGTITFELYGPDDASCTATPVSTSAPVTVSGNGSYDSPDFTPTQAGTYRYIASYTGDSNNNSATGACNAANESVRVAPAVPVAPTITETPPAVDTSTTATFKFSGGPGETFECSVDGGAFAACTSGVSFPAPVGDHTFAVRALNSDGVAGPAASYSWQVQAVAQCQLRQVRARLVVFRGKDKIRLAAHYRSDTAALVNVTYYEAKPNGSKGRKLGQVSASFARAGVFRTTKQLSSAKMAKLRSWRSGFVASFRVPETPGFCARAFTKRLTERKTVEHQSVWFQGT